MGDSNEKLIDVFNEVWSNYHHVDDSSEPASSLQQSIQDGLNKLSLLSTSLEQLSMFSENEDIDEVATPDLRYFLVFPLIASFNSKQQCDIKNRLEILKVSLEQFIKFLKLCLNYNIGCRFEIEDALRDDSQLDQYVASKPDIQRLNAARDAKIAKYRKTRLQAEEIKELESKLHDEEILRKFWLLQIDKWLDASLDEVRSLKMEMSMLERMKNISQKELQESKSSVKVGMKPFVLTRDKLQTSVFGAGYPSLPTMTLEQYFEREAAAGRLPDQPTKPSSEKLAVAKDSDDDYDEEEKLKKQREFDDWKDTHRRGAGNRKNMG